ncbi:MAG: hypothetical protein WDN00_15365 [Limisphaerales bacterium]
MSKAADPRAGLRWVFHQSGEQLEGGGLARRHSARAWRRIRRAGLVSEMSLTAVMSPNFFYKIDEFDHGLAFKIFVHSSSVAMKSPSGSSTRRISPSGLA